MRTKLFKLPKATMLSEESTAVKSNRRFKVRFVGERKNCKELFFFSSISDCNMTQLLTESINIRLESMNIIMTLFLFVTHILLFLIRLKSNDDTLTKT